MAEPQVPPGGGGGARKLQHQQQPRRPVPIVPPKVDLIVQSDQSSKKPLPKPKPRSANVNINNNYSNIAVTAVGDSVQQQNGSKTTVNGRKVSGKSAAAAATATAGDSDTMTRTKVILNEAADAVAKSFTKQTQGINKGRKTINHFLLRLLNVVLCKYQQNDVQQWNKCVSILMPKMSSNIGTVPVQRFRDLLRNTFEQGK